MEKNVKVSILLQTYGNLLTENQVYISFFVKKFHNRIK